MPSLADLLSSVVNSKRGGTIADAMLESSAGASPELGLSAAQRAWLQQHGVFRDPNNPGPLDIVRAGNEAVGESAATLGDLVLRGGNALLRGGTAAAGQGVAALTGDETGGRQAERDLNLAATMPIYGPGVRAFNELAPAATRQIGAGAGELGTTLADAVVSGAYPGTAGEAGAANVGAGKRGAQLRSRRPIKVAETSTVGPEVSPGEDTTPTGPQLSNNPPLPDPRADLKTILDLRAGQMDLPIDKRIQPTGDPMFDLTPENYTSNMPQFDEAPYVPRNTTEKGHPLGDRIKPLIDNADAIAEIIANRSREHLGGDQQYFYHIAPVLQKARELGVPEDDIQGWVDSFSKHYAVTSPRTNTEQNLRNASLLMAKKQLGIDPTEILGPGTVGDDAEAGISERGYPMMMGDKVTKKGNIQKGIHKSLSEAVDAGGINPDTNPKPETFRQNVAGNLQGVTADSHAIRGALLALNDVKPGGVPLGWFTKDAREAGAYEAYLKDPKTLTSDMLNDSLGSQQINKSPVMTEYGPISDIYKKVAEKLGVTPAEAQSLAWFSGGDLTNLGSDPKSLARLISERVNVTAKATGWTPEEVFKKFLYRKIPLLGVAGAAALGAQGNGEDRAPLGSGQEFAPTDLAQQFQVRRPGA
jgi:hypothetical protein